MSSYYYSHWLNIKRACQGRCGAWVRSRHVLTSSCIFYWNSFATFFFASLHTLSFIKKANGIDGKGGSRQERVDKSRPARNTDKAESRPRNGDTADEDGAFRGQAHCIILELYLHVQGHVTSSSRLFCLSTRTRKLKIPSGYWQQNCHVEEQMWGAEPEQCDANG